MTTATSIGEQLRDWRQRRRLSQMDLALDAEISTRHLSFVETGRASPSRDMVLRLAAELEVPLRERNTLLLAAGYAPAFPERSLADPALKPALDGITALLKAHEPFPALAVDRKWGLVAANGPVLGLMEGAAEWLRPTPDGLMNFVSTTMVFGAPFDAALAELAIETFLPADEATMAAVRGL